MAYGSQLTIFIDQLSYHLPIFQHVFYNFYIRFHVVNYLSIDLHCSSIYFPYYWFINLFMCPCIHLIINASIYLFIYWTIHLFNPSTPHHLFIYLNIHLFIHSPILLFIYPSNHPFIFLTFFLSIYLYYLLFFLPLTFHIVSSIHNLIFLF